MEVLKRSIDSTKIQIENISFESYEDLFNFGASNVNTFNTPLSKFDADKMKFKGITSQGQTALGPALIAALGIASKHGKGSTIMAITDGVANKGILDSLS